MCFADTTRATAISFDHAGQIARNAPSLVNADLNHLLMQDGKHISLQAQARAVITDPSEMGSSESDVLRDVLSCPDYRKGFETLLQQTPQAPSITMEHVLSALTMYYVKFSSYRSPFDEAMDRNGVLDAQARAFELFFSEQLFFPRHPTRREPLEVLGVFELP